MGTPGGFLKKPPPDPKNFQKYAVQEVLSPVNHTVIPSEADSQAEGSPTELHPLNARSFDSAGGLAQDDHQRNTPL